MKPRVSLVGCDSYEPDSAQACVSKAVNLLGGISEFVNVGDKVVVKPNLLRGSEPDKTIVTHPSIVKAVVLLVADAGAKPIIVDSPGGPASKRLLKRAYEKAGLAKVADETGAQLSYDTSSALVDFPQGKLIKAFDVLNVVSDADAVITVPKLKTHSLTYLTGATKILYGVVPGLSKVAYHAKLPDVEKFSQMLLDLNSLVKPRLCVMDAVVGMEGNGPSAGFPKKIGAILAGADPLAVDVVAAALVGFDPMDVQTIKAAKTQGTSTGRVEDIEVVGEKIENLKVSDFTPPVKDKTPWFMPSFTKTLMKDQLTAYPCPNQSCIGCGICETNCPVKAITIKEGSACMNLSKCIRCYCCHEMCPHHAIDLKKPWLMRLTR